MIPGMMLVGQRRRGGAGGAIYATWDTAVGTGFTFTNGNRTVAGTGSKVSRGNIALSGLQYFEVSYTPAGNGIGPGLATTAHTLTNYLGSAAGGYGYYLPAADVYVSAAVVYNGATDSTTPVTVGFAFDASTRKLWVRRSNGTWEGGGDPAAGTSPTLTLAAGTYYPACTPGTTGGAHTINAGQAPFVLWTPSAGYGGVS